LEASPPIPPSLAKVEQLKVENKPSSNEVRALEAELGPLHSSLRYEFLGPNPIYHVIVNASFNALQTDSLRRALREHHKTIRYTLDDLQGIHPSMFMHQILIQDYHKALN